MVTVDSAIKKGRWLLFWLPLFVFLGAGGLLACIFLYLIAGDVIWINIVCTLAILLLPVILTAVYYFFMLPRWRIWAFSNVRNVHELKQRAILGQIYPKDNSFWWRLEIKSAAQIDTLENLEQRFDQPDVFEEDYSIPFQTTYSYPKSDKFIFLLFALGNLAVAIFMFDVKRTDQIFVCLIAFAGAVALGVSAYKRFRATEPQLIISNDGITSKENGFHGWDEIQNEQVFWVSAGRASYYGLSYELNGETIKMSLRDLTGLSSYKVDHVLRTYRGRYQREHSIKR